MSAVITSIINLKGGVGKSTLTMMLGEFLAFRHSQNVLLIDMDAQANLSYCMLPENEIRRQESEERTTYDLFRKALKSEALDINEFIAQPPLIVSNVARSGMLQPRTDIHMVVSTPSVAQLDEDLLELWDKNKPMPHRIRETLVDALKPALENYSYILIDCPPGLSIFSSAALMASDYFISPVIPEPLSLQGVELVKRRVIELRNRLGSKAEFKGAMLNIVKHYRNTHRSVSEYVYTSGMSDYLPFQYWLPDNERLRTLGEFDPDVKGGWAMGVDRKFPDLHHKYAVSHRLKNPGGGALSRQNEEGVYYRLEDRIGHLVEEFRERCAPTKP